MKPIPFIVAAALAMGSSVALAAGATAWPSKPVTVISPFPPGGGNDQVFRLVEPSFQATFRQPLVLESRPGAGGNIGAEAVVRSAPDGHALLMTVDTVATVNPRLYRHLRFSADADLVPVIYLARSAQTLACHPSVPVRSVAELMAHARTHDLSYASGGQGVPGHLAAEMFLAATGLRMTHIPYKGPTAAVQDLVGGNVHCGFLATPTAMPHVKSGRLRGLAVTSAQRSPLAPELPTLDEAGVTGYEAAFGQLLMAPRGTPAAVLSALNEVVTAALSQPEARATMAALGLEFAPNTPEQAAMRLRQDVVKWGQVVDRLGLKAD